ncbi:hypothetical protein ABE61_16065 [Lysinibacillus sphaericus]|nr:hypothetical protein [Lysinibacillus sphaericus]MBG9477957.1 hypothetical protein [Lysinibacillus sphaericus]MBG9594097.1 hypothetical protein [Lysinibacillus sphaericus]
MKMSKKIDSDAHQIIKEQLANLPNYMSEENNSFAYLEKGTLNLLITHLIAGEKKIVDKIGDEEIETRMIKQLDEMLEESKEQFEEVISLLKKLS